MKLKITGKLLLIRFFILMLLPLNVIKAQNSFDGKMKFKVQDEKGKVSYITYMFQNGDMRADLPTSAMGSKTYMIVKNKSMYMVMPEQKMYIKYSGSLDKLMNSDSPMADISNPNKNEKKPDFKKIWAKAKTGKTKTILGHLCYKFFLPNDNGGGLHIWATKDLGNISMEQNPMSPNPMLSTIKKLGSYFPLLTKETNKAGETVSKLEVVKIKKQQLDSSSFEIPSDFKQMKMPGVK